MSFRTYFASRFVDLVTACLQRVLGLISWRFKRLPVFQLDELTMRCLAALENWQSKVEGLRTDAVLGVRQKQVGGQKILRIFFYWILYLPVIVFLSLPAVCYVSRVGIDQHRLSHRPIHHATVSAISLRHSLHLSTCLSRLYCVYVYKHL